MTVVALYQCPHCEHQYEDQAAAEACFTTAHVPVDTKLMTRYNDASAYVYVVRNISKASCCQAISLSAHPAFKSSMQDGWPKGGVCLLNKKPKKGDWPEATRPLTVSAAKDAVDELERELKRLDRQKTSVRKRIAVLTAFVGEHSTPAPTP